MADPVVARRGSGWIAFAGVMLILAGLIDIVNGLWALGHQDTRFDSWFFENDIEAWGWFYLIVGIVIVLAGFAVFSRAPWAVLVGVVVSLLGAVAHMFWIFQQPFASIVLVVLNVLVLYALLVYGDRDALE